MTRVLREARRFAAGRAGAGIVGVSGGADSVALLRALRSADVTLVVAHVNHRLRGAESDGDEAFVRELCAGLGLECRVLSADVAALAAGDNLESTARRVRYEFFARVAGAVGAGWVATAHTADDQAETVLHRLIRGTGIQGLRGIAAERPNDAFPGVKDGGRPLVRPLLAVTRADVVTYLNELGQPFRTDSSNADPKFTRNRVRHELLPLLRTFNPEIVGALAHLAEHANEAHDIVIAAAADLLSRAERPPAAGTLILDAATLRSASPGLARAALRLVWEREGWPVSDMTFAAWERAVSVAGGSASACDFPGGVRMRGAGKVVQLTRRA
ncbi:tRNA(Ile)-lysidine synthase [Gemmata obscuriglobus]|uniref:tRNA lysidine(34) synthetase TilS n=1 Tax=Gemmata obscuriglobus TaxID=114 RepID=UPI0011CD271B|nr:tRNA(Ile)-lysidine synthase [Gemmata obscuriglobus]VTS07229.1 trna -lysidine synthetase : tRNA(Ile)-lysidine synthase OS=Planctomyces maris DSM 8797 GN=tilS PE=3 SV=1: ATP_bind_3 [Gemmata obscuriglobus UQM 2246]